MHRIPLYLQGSTLSWNRNTGENELFERVLNHGNVTETQKFLSILDREALNFKESQKTWAMELYNKTHVLLSNPPLNDDDIGMVNDNFTKIILRGPPDSSAFINALKFRGQLFTEHHMTQRAQRDFEMLLDVSKKSLLFVDLCEAHGYLTICYFINNNNKAKAHYEVYQTLKRELPFMTLQEDRFAKIERTLDKMKVESKFDDNMAIEIPKKGEFIIPYLGFNSNAEIPLSSSLCYVANTNDSFKPKESGVFSLSDIPKGSIVLVEHSFEIGVHTPLVQCEYCLKRDYVVYTCLKCRYKTYCSIDCMNNDKIHHEHECDGYENALLLILDAVPLFRFFQRVIHELHLHIFSQEEFQQPRNAHAIWTSLPKAIKKSMLNQRPPITLILNKPNYGKLSNRQYSTLIATALRLTVYISCNTDLFEKYYKNLKISTKEQMILTGCLLIRIQCHILLNTMDFEFNLPRNDKSFAEEEELPSYYVKPFSEDVPVDDINAYYKIDPEQDLAPFANLLATAEKDISRSELSPARHTNECQSIQRLLSTYKDKIVENCISSNSEDFLLFSEAAVVPTTELSAEMINKRLTEMTEEERSIFMENFAKSFHKQFFSYFQNIMKNNNSVPQVISSFCTTLSKFRHSCKPNVEVTFMDNGFIIGKAVRKIKKHEELLVSYKAHHFRHPRYQRIRYLSNLRITCKCELCQKPLAEELINKRSGVNCHICGREITAIMAKCDICNTYYTTEMIRFQKELKTIENEIKKEKDERNLYLLHLCLYKLGEKNFSKYHETGIDVSLEYVRFLAYKNAGKQTFDIIMELQERILIGYELEEIWFSFYNKLLTIICIILTNNIDKQLHSLPVHSLKKLCDLGIFIVKGQYDYIRFYEAYDYNCIMHVEDKRRFLLWQNELAVMDLLPLVHKLLLPALTAADEDKDVDEMPSLMD